MQLTIQGWKSNGLRCPDMEIKLNTAGTKGGISLIQMPNGTGKTTTLEMLRICFTGEAESWSTEKVGKYLRLTSDSGSFILHLILDNTPLTYEISFNRTTNPVKYITSSPLYGGVSEQRHVPPELIRFFKPKFVNLFVFDGEFAEDLLNKTKAEADHAVDALCQLDLIEDISACAREDWNDVTGAKTAQGLTQKQSRFQSLKSSIEKLETAVKEAESKIETEEKNFESLNADVLAYDIQNKVLMEEREKGNNERNTAKAERDLALSELFSLLRNPIYISDSISKGLESLRDDLDRAKLPSSASRQFFIELADEDTCICGREIGHEESVSIKTRAKNYLSEDTTSVINSLKEDISNNIENETPSFAKLRKSFEEKQAELKKADLNVSRIAKAFRDNSLEERNKKEKLCEESKRTIDKLESLIKKLNSPEANPSDDTKSLPTLKILLTQAEDDLSEVADKVELGTQTRVIEALCSEVLETARNAIKTEITKSCNERLEAILAHSPLRVEGIDKCLNLAGQDSASVGQVLSVGYTFLTAILHRSQHDFPLVVDSPANPIDGDVRAEIGAMIPELCHQFIALTISPEKYGFVPALEKASSGNVDFITAFRKTEQNKDLLTSLDGIDYVQTDDGCVVKDRGFFMDFQLEVETEESSNV